MRKSSTCRTVRSIDMQTVCDELCCSGRSGVSAAANPRFSAMVVSPFAYTRGVRRFPFQARRGYRRRKKKILTSARDGRSNEGPCLHRSRDGGDGRAGALLRCPLGQQKLSSQWENSGQKCAKCAAMAMESAEQSTYSDSRDLAEHFGWISVAQWETQDWQDGLRVL